LTPFIFSLEEASMAKKRFEYDSIQDVHTIIKHIEAIADGFRNGKLDFSYKDQELNLNPKGLLEFSLEASSKGRDCKLKLKFKWEEKPREKGTLREPLIIRTNKTDV
jgi:amphi-Trp domain-containing protein